ncbi:ABC transporter permease [Lysinibacillus fusiformis]|uniref:ABC transporter permease n=1 Tax=Lysinibacillus fusiformis TaxID=28031 RepID=UPI0011BBEBDE|nr:ABC transporter permease [Lysinibacillus fusiformis]QDZ99166.1 ABC transporter permease [Lysinibacillus fusiformis]UXJ66834.1 ABC transporter permease [Lysinibacillus fusiformis]WEA37348.1 ABC transporter permease [Lysinibacillus fusiformis]
MWSYFKFEFKQFFTNKKNVAIYFLLAFATFFYVFKIAPAYNPIEQVEYEEIEARYLTRQEFLDSMEGQNIYRLHPAIIFAIDIFKQINPIDKARLEALDEGDLKKYAEVTRDWYYFTNAITYKSDSFSYNSKYFIKKNDYAEDDAFYAYLEQAARYDTYANAKYELSTEIFEQRTALQTFERLLKGLLPVILIVCVLLLAIDIVTKDRRHPSIIKGFPISDWKKLLVKMVVVLLGSLVLFVPLIAGLIIIGLQSGFGNFNLPSPMYAPHLDWRQEGKFEPMTLGMFLGQTLILLLTWFMVIINVVLLCSILFRNEMMNFAIGLLLIFGEKFYFSRYVGYFWDIQIYPTSYIQVGQIVSKQRNFYYMNDFLDFNLGLQLLLVLAVVVMLFMLLTVMNRRYKLIK